MSIPTRKLVPGLNCWYQEAFYLTRKDWRLFRLDRIVQVKTTETRFVARNREEYQFHPVPPVTKGAVVYTIPEQAKWMGTAALVVCFRTETSEGLVVLTCQNIDWHTFTNWLCMVNDYIVRIEPVEVRVQLRKKTTTFKHS